MATRAERVAALDGFMAAEKTIVQPNIQAGWLPGFTKDERQLKWPLEVGGEQFPDSSIVVVGYPWEKALRFRLLILCPDAVCRLDFTEESHGNAPPQPEGVPPLVVGPHYHPWLLNRPLFFRDDAPVRLGYAVPFDAGRAFDAALRWFCRDNNIKSLPPDHRIELPSASRML